MDDALDRIVWIDRFVMHTRALGVRADLELIKDLAAALWPTLRDMQPEAAAQEEYERWRPQDF
jgi:hypothetical protein